MLCFDDGSSCCFLGSLWQSSLTEVIQMGTRHQHRHLVLRQMLVPWVDVGEFFLKVSCSTGRCLMLSWLRGSDFGYLSYFLYSELLVLEPLIHFCLYFVYFQNVCFWHSALYLDTPLASTSAFFCDCSAFCNLATLSLITHHNKEAENKTFFFPLSQHLWGFKENIPHCIITP